MLLIYFVLICAKSWKEVGYIFSEGRQRFLTHNGVDIVVAKYSEKPLKFQMVKMRKDQSSNVLLYPIPGMGNKVADFNFSAHTNKRWYFYPEHGKWNQRTRFVLMPGNVLKIVIGDSCLGVDDADRVVGESCKDDQNDSLQIFSWVPITQKRKVKAWINQNRRRAHSDEYYPSLYEDERDFEKSHDQESSGYDGDENSSSDYHGRSGGAFHEFDYDSGIGGHGPFKSGIGSFGGRRRRYRRDEEMKHMGERDEESCNNDEGKDYREGRMFRKKRMGKLLRNGKARQHKPYGNREHDENFHQGRNPTFSDIGSPNFVNYLDNSQEYEQGAIEETPFVPCDDSLLMFGEDPGHCNVGGAGENEICKINKTTMAFRKMVGIPI
ncbi:hypothetical protein EROM_081480 [Encephalitozoon romaleae SJ-2008]|uniref:Uncharacterized protein n=1 Tax=Encephalitozoon romaleae (strain SJ-2008) TaxID=1178016 RepID=I7AP33_ENCRO|nr:hypothetical protein EROM_081480 [Encephalitozoon romaleae SJ-2008]AFN83564.1 hypothetical protein EROM_081480 [Encephalitozoon romaleae SJ-2008]